MNPENSALPSTQQREAAPTLLAAWERTVRAAPTARLLIDSASIRSFSRAEIEQSAETWARQHGAISSHRTVAIAETNSAEWLHVFLGLLKCEAVIAPLDPGEPVDAQRQTAGQIGAHFLWRNGELSSLGKIGPKRRSAGRLIKSTSGTTGAPRALLFRDAEMLADGRQICAAMDIREDDLNLGLIPWGHSYGLGNLIMPLILQGTAIVFGAVPLPQAIASVVETWRPTIFPAVPALLRALVDASIAPEQLASLRTVISAGAPLTPEIAQSFHARFGRRVHNFYGSSETGGISYDATGDSAALARGVGQALPGVQLSFDRRGRLIVSSDAVFRIGNRQCPAFRTNDLARISEHGELVLLGRAGRFVKIGGRRLNLAEVEHVLKQLPGVRDALVTPHAERTDALAAAVVTERSGAEIREALRDRLAPWKIPKKILTLAAFPLTNRGKTDARQVRSLLGS
jgi:long-chain acyl-CoA synthetase